MTPLVAAVGRERHRSTSSLISSGRPRLSHYAYLNVLFGVLQVLKEGVLAPHDTRLFVGSGVGVSFGHTRLTAKETVEVGALFVCSSFLYSVALAALGLENLGSLLFAHDGSFTL